MVHVFALDIADGVVQAIRCVVNPDKLRHLGPVSELARKPPPEPGSPRRSPRPGPRARAGRRPQAGSIPGTGTSTVRLIKAMARIIVTGATGNVGREVTTQLLSAGVPVRAFVRDARTPRLLEGAEIAAGDLSVPETLEGALTGIEAVFLVWPFLTTDGAPAILATIARTARRLVYLSSSGVNEDTERQTDPISSMPTWRA